MKKNTFLSIIKYFVSLAIAFGILYFLFKNQDPIQLFQEIKKVDGKWVLFSMIFGAWAIINRGLRWIVLIDALGYKASKKNSIAAVAILYFTNLFIPRGGEISRCTALSKAEKVPVDKLFGTILIERTIDFVFLFGLIFLTLLLKLNEISKFYFAVQAQQTSSTNDKNLIFLLLILLVFILSFIGFKKRIKKSRLYTKILKFFVGLKEGFVSIKKMKQKTTFWFHTLSIWIMYFLMTYICFFSISETAHLTLADGLFILILGGIGMVIPTPGGIGSYHAIVMIGLSVLGVGTASFGTNNDTSNPALLFPTIVHAGQTLMAIIMGLIALLILFLSKKKSNVSS